MTSVDAVGRRCRRHHVINYVTAMNHRQYQKRTDTREYCPKMADTEDEIETKSRLQTALEDKQPTSRFVTRKALLFQATHTGCSETETKQTSNVAVATGASERDGDRIDDQFISCRSKQIHCYAMEVKLHCRAIIMNTYI